MKPFRAVDATPARRPTSTQVAARQGAADVVRLLLARGASRDTRTGTGRTALVVATAFGELQTVRALLRAGARPDLNLLAMDPAEAEQSLFPPVWKSTRELVVA